MTRGFVWGVSLIVAVTIPQILFSETTVISLLASFLFGACCGLIAKHVCEWVEQ